MQPYIKNADLLIKERIKKGYTQKAFAKAVGISNVRLCELEKIKNCSVGIETADRIAKQLEIKWSDVFDFRERRI